MLRRPPTMISLGDGELHHYLQHIRFYALSDEFNHLCLDDQHYGYNGNTSLDASSSSSSSLSHVEDKLGLSMHQVSMYTGHPSGSRCHTTILKSSTASLSVIDDELVQEVVHIDNAPVTTSSSQTSSELLQRRTSPPRPRQSRRVTWAALPQQLQTKDHHTLACSHTKENDHPSSSSRETWATADANKDVRFSDHQISCLSPDTLIPDIMVDGVPLRDLALPSTPSYEAVVAKPNGSNAIMSLSATVDPHEAKPRWQST